MSEEKTEAPTPKKKQEARKQGQTPQSKELTSAAVLLAGIWTVKSLGTEMQAQLSELVAGGLTSAGDVQLEGPPTLGFDPFAVLTDMLPPILGVICFAAVATAAAQGGFLLSPHQMMPQMKRINPISGIGRLLSMQGLMQTGKTLVKFIAIAATGGLVLRGHMNTLSTLGTYDLWTAVSVLFDLLWDVLFKCVIVVVVIGLADAALERRKYMNSVKMTKQEVIDEMRQSEGDPKVKGQQKRAREQAHFDMLQKVPTADVVVTNPTHYAVALKYDPVTMVAPIVIAKGKDLIALRIREAAKEARVPVLENPPLARALYKHVPIDGAIPPDLYMAVAEVLAFVFRLRAERARGA